VLESVVGGFVKGFDTLLLQVSTVRSNSPVETQTSAKVAVRCTQGCQGGAAFSQPCFKESRVVAYELELGLSDLTAAQIGEWVIRKLV
jgi:hypothetical protein